MKQRHSRFRHAYKLMKTTAWRARSGDVVASGNASYSEVFNMGPGSLYYSGANGRIIVTPSQDGSIYLNPATGAQLVLCCWCASCVGLETLVTAAHGIVTELACAVGAA